MTTISELHFVDLTAGGGIKLTDKARTLKARYDAGVTNRNADNSGVAIPVLTPDRAEKRQNGRRFKEDGEPMFTLTGQDRHGVGVEVEQIEHFENEKGVYVLLKNGAICYAVWYEKYQCYIAIRKLTPKECFRLQGWTDDYFEKAAFVNSDSQLYKQAGNSVTVNVIHEIAKRLKEDDAD